MIAYLLDEHLPPLYRVQLQRRRPELTVWMIGDAGAPPRGTLDPDILIWCEAHGFILVTNNRSSMPVHLADHLAQGRHVPGIFVFNATVNVGRIIDDLHLIACASLEGEFQDRIEYLPLI